MKMKRPSALTLTFTLALTAALPACGSEDDGGDGAGGAAQGAGGEDPGPTGGDQNGTGGSFFGNGGNGGTPNAGGTPQSGGTPNAGGTPGAGGDPGAGGEPAPPLPSWGDGSPGVTVGPFVEFHTFRSGCGEQIWTRFIPLENFAIGEISTHVPGAGVNTVTFFDTPVFGNQEKTVYLINGEGGYNEGDYTFDFTVGYENGSRLTHTIDAPAERMYRWDGQFELMSARTNGASEVQLTMTPRIGGSLFRVFVYDATTECLVGSETFFDGIPFGEGIANEFSTHIRTDPGAQYLVVLQGVDSGRGYDFYATLDLTGP